MVGSIGDPELRSVARFADASARMERLAYGLTTSLPAEPSPGAFDPGARVRCVAAGGSIDACGDYLAGRGLPTAAGRYTLLLHHAVAGIAFDF